MTETRCIPAKGRTVPLEDGSDWPSDEKGAPIAATVEASLYVRNRLRDGDLVLVEDGERQEPASVAADGQDNQEAVSGKAANREGKK